jgi:UDP-2,3-diacylglucosamine pyrophosphatase LpxH
VKNYRVYREKWVLGDVHGEWSVILNHLNKVSDFDFIEKTEVCYIQVGDFGIGYNKIENELAKLKILDQNLRNKNSDLFIIRGNHDDPKFFKENELLEFKNELTNIHFVPDYTVLNIDGDNILFIGGAVSIDRKWTQFRGGKWWEDEVVNFDFDKIKNFTDIDRVICHTAPDFVEPLGFNQLVYNFALNDDVLLEDLTIERANMTKMITKLMNNNQIKTFLYGHFHAHNKFRHNDCDFIGLNINQFYNL